MAVSDRIVVLRQGKLVAERRHGRDGSPRAGRADGRPPDPGAEGRADAARPRRPVAAGRHAGRRGASALAGRLARAAWRRDPRPRRRLRQRAERAGRSPQRPRRSRAAARCRCSAQEIHYFDPPSMVRATASRAFRRTGTPKALIGDMSVDENLISERYREPPFSPARLDRLDRGARLRRAGSSRDFDVRCPAPQARDAPAVRRQHAEADPGPRDGARAAHHPRQPADARARYRRGRLCASATPDRRARAGPAILLISEDLDEILALSDRVVVMYRGRMSAPMARGDVTIRRARPDDGGPRLRRGRAHAA